MDAFSVLGIPASSSKDKIKSAYRRLARSCHPDVRPDKEQAEREFKELQQAYELALRLSAAPPRRRPPPPPRPKPPPPPPPKNPPPPHEKYRVQAIGRWEMEDFGAVVRTLSVKRSYAQFGGEFVIEFGPTFAVKLKVPKDTQNGQRFRIVSGGYVIVIKIVFEDNPSRFGPLNE